MIELLRLKGFKSFGRQCEFEFSPKFTAIVGPNGSGKSNILDALKWILGEGSASGLRITKQSDLLFQGSKSTNPAENAEVMLKLSEENNKGTLRRTYSKEAGSWLSFDGRKILLQELDTVKKRFNLNGEGFALIGQGEISDAIHQRPKERRKQLDELFGIERYREKREDTLKKLSEVQGEAERVQTLISELEARRAEISEDVAIAVQAQGIIDNLDVLRRDYYFFRRYTQEKEQENLQLSIYNLKEKLDETEAFRRFWTLGLKHYEGKLTADSTKNYVSQLDELTAQQASIHRTAFQSSNQVKDITARRRALTEELRSLQAQHKVLLQELEHTSQENHKMTLELEAKQREVTEQQAKIAEAQEKYRTENDKRKKLLDDLAKIKLKTVRLESEINAIKTSHENNLHEIKALEVQRDEKQKIIEAHTQQKEILEEKFTSLSITSQHQSTSTQALHRELTHLETQYNNLSNSKYYTAGIYPEPVKIILEASRKKILLSKPQILAEVFSCSSSEVAGAIEAYLGARQNWLLVHTLEEAQEGIDFLKQNRAGRVTYLTLDRCRPRISDSRINTGGKVTGWAMDLITVKDEWAEAVSHVMGDLLIVEDYSTASRIIREGVRFPIATLEGEVFAPSGTVSGGASRQRTGAVVAKQKLDELNLQLETLRKEITEAKGKLEASARTEERLRLEYEEVSNQLEKTIAELNSEHRNLKAIIYNLERLNSEQKNSELNIEKLEAEHENSREKIIELETQLKAMPEIQEEDYSRIIMPLKNELKYIQEKINVTRTLYDRVAKEIDSVNARIGRAESELKTGIENEAEHRKKLFDLAREKKKAHQQEAEISFALERYNQEFSGIRKRIEKVRTKLERVSHRILALQNNISEIESKITQSENEITQLIELWDYKYPYDSNEARTVEGGRELTSALRKLERELKSLGAYNIGALSEDNSLMNRIDFLTEQLEDVNLSHNELKKMIEIIDTQAEENFTQSMKEIDGRFNELFKRLFGGGEAHLILQEAPTIWERGVEIYAQPPGKKLQNISQLSGGEQSLTSIALIFATLEATGTPLAVLDEVDAALDEYNLIRFAELIKEYSSTLQIIAMTHRRATMERADLIYGVTMIEPGQSATVGINPENYE